MASLTGSDVSTASLALCMADCAQMLALWLLLEILDSVALYLELAGLLESSDRGNQ